MRMRTEFDGECSGTLFTSSSLFSRNKMISIDRNNEMLQLNTMFSKQANFDTTKLLAKTLSCNPCHAVAHAHNGQLSYFVLVLVVDLKLSNH